MPVRHLLGVLPLAALLFALPTAAAAQKPPKPSKPHTIPGPVSITAKPNPTIFSQPVSVTGDVTGAKAGVVVTLQQRAATGGTYTAVATGQTDNAGRYALTNRPLVNVYYRVLAATSPAQQSGELLVRVRMLTGIRISDSTPKRGQRVRFFGIVRPAHTGRAVAVQRRSSTGRWVTLARTTLRSYDAQSSRYSRRVRIRRSGSYRVRVAGDADHATGLSRTRTVTVH